MKMFSWQILAGVGGISFAIIIGLIIYHVITTQGLENKLLTCKNDYKDLNATHNNLTTKLFNMKEEANRSSNQTKELQNKNAELFSMYQELLRKDNKNENITCRDAFIDAVINF